MEYTVHAQNFYQKANIKGHAVMDEYLLANTAHCPSPVNLNSIILWLMQWATSNSDL